MNNKIKTLSQAIDALENFLDNLDELYGLSTMTYGVEASDALDFLYDYKLKHTKDE